MKKGIYCLSVIFVFIFGIGLIFQPQVCKIGVINGLMLSSNIIIPSLFPFSVLVLFILKSELTEKLNIPADRSIFILSLIGGYPIGAKLLSQAVELKKIEKATASELLNFCINAGPAFIISGIGSGIFGNKKAGYLLFLSHIISSAVLAATCKKSKRISTRKPTLAPTGIIDNFVSSVSLSASATLSVCSFVILFSVISNYISFFSKKVPLLKILSCFLEVTNASTQTRSILNISFLLGFSGICIWFQVWGIARNFKIKYFKFIIFRILHGALSYCFTYIFIKIFRISLPTLSNSITASFQFTATAPQVAISLIIMGIIFIISVNGKNYAGNLLEDLV